jgi:hypothetical protein
MKHTTPGAEKGHPIDTADDRAATAEQDEAARLLVAVQRLGYVAHMLDYDQSLSIGLPDTFEYESKP